MGSPNITLYYGSSSANFSSGDTIDIINYPNASAIRVWKAAGSGSWSELDGNVTITFEDKY